MKLIVLNFWQNLQLPVALTLMTYETACIHVCLKVRCSASFNKNWRSLNEATEFVYENFYLILCKIFEDLFVIIKMLKEYKNSNTTDQWTAVSTLSGGGGQDN
jgi:hypothetical protein